MSINEIEIITHHEFIMSNTQFRISFDWHFKLYYDNQRILNKYNKDGKNTEYMSYIYIDKSLNYKLFSYVPEYDKRINPEHFELSYVVRKFILDKYKHQTYRKEMDILDLFVSDICPDLKIELLNIM